MSGNSNTTTEQAMRTEVGGADNTAPSFRQKIGSMTYDVEVHFSKDSRLDVAGALRRVILHEADKHDK